MASSRASADNSRTQVPAILRNDDRTGTTAIFDCTFFSRTTLPCRHLLALTLAIDKVDVKSAQVNCVRFSASPVVFPFYSALCMIVGLLLLSLFLAPNAENVSDEDDELDEISNDTELHKNITKLAVLVLMRASNPEIVKRSEWQLSRSYKAAFLL